MRFFLRHFGKLLRLEESFINWLVVKLRPLQKQKLTFATFHSHFLEYQKKSNNYYQLKKLIEFFDVLQTNSLIKFFSDKEYRNLVTISEVVLTKGKQYCWVRIIMERKFNLKLFMSLVL